jgi:hypothetical protein
VQRSQPSQPLRIPGAVWAAIVAAALDGGRWRRQTLLANRSRRDAVVMIVVSALLLFLQRVVSHAVGLPTRQALPMQMISLASIMALVAATRMRELWFLPRLLLVACLPRPFGTSIDPSHPPGNPVRGERRSASSLRRCGRGSFAE